MNFCCNLTFIAVRSFPGLPTIYGVSNDMPVRDKIFISYSHLDKKPFEEFKTMLAPAIQRGVVDVWDDK